MARFGMKSLMSMGNNMAWSDGGTEMARFGMRLLMSMGNNMAWSNGGTKMARWKRLVSIMTASYFVRFAFPKERFIT